MTARHHVTVHLDGPAAQAIDALRAVWDPVMRGIAPAHVTVVYPEETVDTPLLLERLRRVAAVTAPIPLAIGRITAADEGRGGVFALVDDPTGRLAALRTELLRPPQRHGRYPFHATIAHPRTAESPARCWDALRGHDLAVPVTAHEALWTVTDTSTRTVLARYPFRG
ncbi:2'-5' RNA ligase family protein [Cryptosporangium aurantiacum]|uniref:2'-5' RNA ligase superfamily protein n=1 Tax=Cryptosporangium aurantiacum TaxID=134849 RepID=A0A1M7RPE7_9ACTN|nr:2'-5' RNA ligase family protein [Cryptosporangium aurantiacum]SHN48099.1 2'-5' RNA ligase superfamily protein [Cryptosporangium aurantiacum]